MGAAGEPGREDGAAGVSGGAAKPRTILAIDPSSTVTGYALVDLHERVIDCGKLKPTKVKDEANVRIAAMAKDLAALIGEAKPWVIVIEDSSGKVGKRHGGGGGAGLAIYGKAIGWMMATARASGVPVVEVLENAWTRGTAKVTRQRRIAQTVKGYDPATDPGGDVSDAIGLARWYVNEQKVRR